MFKSDFKAVYSLSIIVAVLAAAAALGGLLLDGLYLNNQFVNLVWQATDAVTLLLALPLLVIGMALTRRGSLRGLLVWLAMLDYMLYNYAYYLFSAAFNWFFLIYLAIYVLSIVALITALLKVDARWIGAQFSPKTPARWISGFMLFVAVGLTAIYTIMSVGFIVSGTAPELIEKTGHITSVVFALDLSLVVPVFAVGAIWLWQRRPWGYIIAGFSLVKGAVYNLVLAFVSLYAGSNGFPEAAAEVPLWLTLSLGSLVAAIFLLANIRQGQESS